MDALNVLQRLGRGHLIDELHAAILAVAEEVVATGQPGAVTVTLRISHDAKYDPALVIIAEEVKRTPPKGAAKGAMFYALEGLLHDRDPRQPGLPEFRVVLDGHGLRAPEDPGLVIREAEGK